MSISDPAPTPGTDQARTIEPAERSDHTPAAPNEPQATADPEPVDGPAAAPSRRRAVLARVVTVLAAALVLATLTLPNRPWQLEPGTFLRLPLEALLLAALLLALPGRPRRIVAAVSGVLLGLVAMVKVGDLGFYSSLGRPFDLVLDWSLLGPAFAFVAESIGRPGAIAIAAGVGLLLLGIPVLTALSTVRLSGVLARNRTGTTRAVASLVVVWVVLAAFGARIVPGVYVADTNATTLVQDHAVEVHARLHDRRAFTNEINVDPFRDVPGDQLLTGLRGKDVLLTFVESYGRDAVADPEFASIQRVLDEGAERLSAAGFTSRSGFLTSPTIGGASWLAHATLLSGLWIDNNQRHRNLLATDRFTLGDAFQRAQWRTVGVMPAVNQAWPEGAFYGYEQFYGGPDLGYQGPRFAFAPMPDQFAIHTFHQRELAAPRDRPVMAELALVSSHSPWTKVPSVVDWDDIDDGEVFQRGIIGTPAAQARTGYRHSINYTLRTLISYLERYGTDDTVMVIVGDHQPAPVVTGENPSPDVPIHIVAKDPAVFAQIEDWNWQEGLTSGADAPVWRMDTFRDRFLTAFGPGNSRAQAQGR
ncbi:sulfatase-like hydrolase/transferase [Micromonospora craniellae]|uniref:Sulfatase n=1 Tax=Micromonospora craniellae TaxID=2294034 RepID=A0A372G201_9ACTN|nr:sulfatase [Micromonospora craniellae]RFS46750.1 sulfatase [Micromonospora craniellae]